MALAYTTGRDLTLTINSVTYNDVASSVTLKQEIDQTELNVLTGSAYVTIKKTATLEVELYQDWGSTSPASVCEALWAAANSAPDTALTFSFDANGQTFSGKVFPVFPNAGGSAPDVLTTSITMIVEDGAVTVA